ncbi:MAG: Ig-like domain-containing protein [Gemmatimonadaceae bacterium]|jgi:hypothetical protein|nr:Ig-like domain-containing protein [Gemmatimonadaceae bacterium]
MARRIVVASMLGIALAGTVACRDGAGPGASLTPARLELQFGDSLIELGTARPVFSLVRAPDGTTIYDVRLVWRIADTAVARVDERGVVRAVGLGRTRVEVEVRRDTAAAAPPLLTGALVVRVTPRVVRRVVLDRDTVTIAREGTVPLVATPEAEDRTPLPERVVSWRSLEPAVAAVAADGTVTGVTAGEARIVAASEGFADTARVTVSPLIGGVDAIEIAPLPDTLPLNSRWGFAATLRRADGTVLRDRVVSWALRTVRGVDVAQFAATDTLAATRRGVLELTASSEGRRATRVLVVDEAFDRTVTPVILRPLDLPSLTFDDTVRVLVTSNTLAPLARLELFLEFRPVPVQETVLPGLSGQRAWVTTIKLDQWNFGLLRLEAIGTDAFGRRGIAALVFARIPAEPQGGPLQGGGRR